MYDFQPYGACESFRFNTLEELLSNRWVASFKTMTQFGNYARSKDMLMVIESNNKHWVIGFVSNRDILDTLPIWTPKEQNFNG